MNIKNILVPVDFSPPSRLALDDAISLARTFRAKLTLMHVVESVSPETIAKEEEQALRILSALVSSEDQDDLDLRVILKSGDIKKKIAEVIREDHTDLVVMGTHGRGLFGRWFVGSITQGMLRNLSIPVFTVCRARQMLSLKRILFATDLSEASRQGFEFALDLAQATKSGLVLLHVLDPLTLSYGGAEVVNYVSEQDIEEAKQRVDALAAEAVKAKVKVETIVIEGGTAESILEAADDGEVDLIVLPIHKKSLVERALLGTTAERVIREAGVPVLSVPGPAEK